MLNSKLGEYESKLLDVIKKQPGLKPTALARIAKINRAHIYSTLERLAKRKLIWVDDNFRFYPTGN